MMDFPFCAHQRCATGRLNSCSIEIGETLQLGKRLLLVRAATAVHRRSARPWGRILAPGGTAKKILSRCRFHEAPFDVIMGAGVETVADGLRQEGDTTMRFMIIGRASRAIIPRSLERWSMVNHDTARRLAPVLSQSGEFAVVLFAADAIQGLIGEPMANLLALAVTLSMAGLRQKETQQCNS
jgi:hypothetical protein